MQMFLRRLSRLSLLPLCVSVSGCGAVAVAGMNGIKGNAAWQALEIADVDASGSVSPKELEGLRAALFARLDRDNDGLWSGAQYAALIAVIPPKKRLGTDALLGLFREPLQIADTNGDGAVSGQEFVAGSDRLFTLLDQNGDGTLLREDFSKVQL